MEILYCWRCRSQVPMLDETEFAMLQDVHRRAVSAVKEYRQRHGTGLHRTPVAELMRPVLETYREMTGRTETDADHVLKHRLVLYGKPCSACERPLRTPHATHCAACGHAA